MKQLLKQTLTATGLSIALLGAGTSLAGPGPERGPGTDVVIERMSERLSLSDDQETRIRQIMESQRSQGEADRERLGELRETLRSNSDSGDNFDAGAVQSAADEIGQITSRMTYQMAESQHQVREVLSDEQRAKLDQMMERRKQHAGHRFGKRGEGRPGEESDDEDI
ncbi:Spy/CpxP family protein refolding chaperone [Parahaliea aestuarii]|uniref:Periplasmic heavy metal sensor n=1 Tax=Parahaliea aestuarii TaxID=1852021 RepID=A0A5C8ZUI3_9GAMM|nr:Spy/CpxP family protein refolding chaperone [Parahaliea aestuarii]TXS91469.1 periplasmic heavy metal sensor [Parahaliea aestuarii]